jgi:hypothetical protein
MFLIGVVGELLSTGSSVSALGILLPFVTKDVYFISTLEQVTTFAHGKGEPCGEGRFSLERILRPC